MSEYNLKSGLTGTQKCAVIRALLFIADSCDGARELDKKGFSGLDTNIGKSLAEKVLYGGYHNFGLTIKQFKIAKHLAFKYRGQLPVNLKKIIDSLKIN